MAWLAWYNFIFLAPLLAGVAMAVLVVATGAIGDSSLESDDLDGDADDGRGFDVLGWFGIGRGVPLSLMLPVLLCAFGLAGLTLDVLLEPVLRLPVLFAPVAALGGLFASSLVGRAFAKAFVKFADVNRKTSIRGSTDLVGCTGSTVFEVDANNGAANIKDAFGNIHRVSVRSKTPLKANLPVRVISAENGIYSVEEQK
jgi:membrane protein implicated in regulation of membrane protease activity